MDIININISGRRISLFQERTASCNLNAASVALWHEYVFEGNGEYSSFFFFFNGSVEANRRVKKQQPVGNQLKGRSSITYSLNYKYSTINRKWATCHSCQNCSVQILYVSLSSATSFTAPHPFLPSSLCAQLVCNWSICAQPWYDWWMWHQTPGPNALSDTWVSHKMTVKDTNTAWLPLIIKG